MIVYGKYQFKLTFTPSIQDYLRLTQTTNNFVSNGNEYYVITCENNGGVHELRYYDRDNNFVVAWNDALGDWTDQAYRVIEFNDYTEVDDSEWTYLENYLNEYSTTISGIYKFQDTPAINTTIDDQLTTGNSFITTGMAFSRIKIDFNDGIYYDDILVYDKLTQTWTDQAYKTIQFLYETDVMPDTYSYITTYATQIYQIRVVVPHFDDRSIQTYVANQVASFTYPVGSDYENTRVIGYYYDDAFTLPVSVGDYVTANTIIYGQFDLIVDDIEQSYYLGLSPHYNDGVYNGLHFSTKVDLLTFYDGIKFASDHIYFDNNGTWVEVFDGVDWVNVNYAYIRVIGMMYVALDIEITTQGSYQYVVKYVPNVTGVSISTNYFVSVLTNGDLPTLTPPTDYQFDGWFYDSLFTLQAQVSDSLDHDVTLYGKLSLPSVFNIILYRNVDVNNSINKSPEMVRVLGGVLRDGCSISKPIVRIDFDNLDYNYAYIEELNRYYYINDIFIVNKHLKDLYLTCDVLMSFKQQIINKDAIVGRTANFEASYKNDELAFIDVDRERVLIESDVKSNLVPSGTPLNNIILIGVK